MIRLAAGIFSTLASGLLAADEFVVGDHAIDNNEHLIYNADTGALSYDANGSDAGEETQFTTLGKHLDLTNQQFFVV
jgi:Ca2+-binding RTX toxin-like protein